MARFPQIPEALTEGETDTQARASDVDCAIAALGGYIKAGRRIPRPSPPDSTGNRAVLPSLASAKLAVYETMRIRGWSTLKLATELDVPEISVVRLLNLPHSSPMRLVDTMHSHVAALRQGRG